MSSGIYRRFYTDDEKQQLTQLHNDKVPVIEQMKIMNRSKCSIYRVRSELGLKYKIVWSKKKIQNVLDRYVRGERSTEIALSYGVSRHRIGQIVKLYGKRRTPKENRHLALKRMELGTIGLMRSRNQLSMKARL